MTSFLPPAFIFIAGAALIPFLRGRLKQVYMILLPALAFLNLLNMPEGSSWVLNLWDYQLIFARVDKLSMVFAYIFVIMAFAGAIYAAHEEDNLQLTAAFLYAGSSLGVVFAGDLLSLFIFWEIMALASTCLVFARRTQASIKAAFRYIMVHLFGGLMLMIGILMHVAETGSLEFNLIGLSGLASGFILLGFAVNAAIFPLSAWLPDAYPESTVVGTVFLSAFTTKTAVYTLARGFAGTEILMWLGITMIIYGIVFAILENDMRRVLSYSVINQVGFMVVGIGIGTELAINGAASHAFAHILYKALLMMSAGAVLYLTGRTKTSELGGLYKTMPWTLVFCLVGAASISGFPLTGGFTTKSMIASAAGYEQITIIWMLLTVASAGVFLHAGIKFPYFVFFAKDSGLRPNEKKLPRNMLVAMGFLAFMCILVGVYPQMLYRLLPYPVSYVPYTGDHVVGQLQLLMFSALAFFMLLKYLKRTETLTMDTDWIYRRGAHILVSFLSVPVAWTYNKLGYVLLEKIPNVAIWFSKNPLGAMKIGASNVVVSMAGDKEAKKALQKVKSAYPGTLKEWSISTAVSIALVIFVVCMILFFS
ncbi:Na(+)/H(+) antiporter subunit D [Desulfosporosinus sp.]|uniref:Na(+)/H(+) antiporter subunit D n=1 Tax=Desulfosporosinus sp. TaxID=157907 RepID=UPI0025B7D2EA|nr:Na(+)/H(+) antiporter subunit D [Desulfosporosinus sp.]MBC2721960.1 Na(+)/H(+) antiporter subunit D [Desulfosporosinus sp.]MBC2728435.1 Na(+)/H(+) antiporter subunit D [Desulfosporosinus sp.]